QTATTIPTGTVRDLQATGDACYLTILPVEHAASSDGGATWIAIASGSNLSAGPSRWLATTHPGPGTVSIYVLAGHDSVAAGAPGSGAFVPRRTGTDLPGPGARFSLHVDRAIGGALALVALALGPPVPTPLLSTTLYVPAPMATQFFVTNGAAG